MSKITIQSISGVITNSSSEVYTIYYKEDIDNIKKLVNAILSTAGSDKTFDDLFCIEFIVDTDWVTTYTGKSFNTYEEYVDCALVYDADINLYEELPLIQGIRVVMRDGSKTEAADLIAAIPEMFEHREIYC